MLHMYHPFPHCPRLPSNEPYLSPSNSLDELNVFDVNHQKHTSTRAGRCRRLIQAVAREQAHSLSSITLDDLLGDGYGAEDAHTWVLDVTPESVAPAIPVESAEEVRARAAVGAPLGTSSSQLAAVGGAAGSSSALTALLLPDYSSGRQRQSDLAEAEKELQLAAPAVRFCLKLHTPPLPDGSGGFFYVAPPMVLKDVGP